VNLLLLLGEFFKIGLFSVGGGLATLPFIYKLADTYDWLPAERIPDLLAVAQSLPGAVGVNLAAYTGFQYAGITGAVTAALGLVSPSIMVILIIARMFRAFRENVTVQAVFSGLRPAAAGLLSAAAIQALSLSLYHKDWNAWYRILRWRETALFAAAFILIRRFKGHPAIYIAAAGALGIALGL
jgi:chromate transporter